MKPPVKPADGVRTCAHHAAGVLYLELGPNEAWRDVEGRPLGERACRPVELGGELIGVPMQLSECPYPGLRFRHANPMNASALKQIVAHWSESMDALAAMRALYQGYCGRSAFDYWDVWRLATMALAWPDYLVRNTQARISSSSLPVVSATVFKIAKGIAPVAQRLALADVLNDGPQRAVSGQELWTFADAHGELLGSNEVCAGPDHLIQEALGVLIDGKRVSSSSWGPPAFQMPTGFARYAVTRNNVEIIDDLYRLMRALAVQDFRARIESAGDGSASIAKSFGAAFAGILKGELLSKTGRLLPSQRSSKLEVFAALVLDDATTAAAWPLAGEVRTLLRACDQPATLQRPQIDPGTARWGEAPEELREELRGRMSQLDGALLRAYHQLCGRLRDALGCDGRPPRGEFTERLIDRRHGPELRQALEARSQRPLAAMELEEIGRTV